MPLQDPKGPNYVRVRKVYVDSGKKEDYSKGEYDYVVELDQELEYVIGCEITGFNLPKNLAPTFIHDRVGFKGNAMVDFQVTDGIVTETFAFQWPEKSYTYENIPVPYLSYIGTLSQLMNTAIEPSPTFGSGTAKEVTFNVASDPDEKTQVSLTAASGTVTFQFQFGTGAHYEISAATEMGFTEADTGFSASILSPNPTFLQSYRYIDVFIDKIEFQPVKRIYMTDNLYYGTTINDPDVTRTRYIQSNPIRRLKTLHITLLLEGGVVPPITTGRPHDLTLTFFTLANEEFVPNWVRQTFAI